MSEAQQEIEQSFWWRQLEEVGKAFRMCHRTFWHGDEE